MGRRLVARSGRCFECRRRLTADERQHYGHACERCETLWCEPWDEDRPPLRLRLRRMLAWLPWRWLLWRWSLRRRMG